MRTFQVRIAPVRIALGSLMVCAAATATARDSGFYLGADLGQAHYPDHASIQLGDVFLSSVDTDTGDFAWSLRGGYRLTRYLALELGTVDLGEGKAKLSDSAGGSHADLRFKARGPYLAAVVSLPFGNWEPFIKTGLMRQNVDLTLKGALDDGTVLDLTSSADSLLKLFWATGFSFGLNDHWRVGAEVDFFSKLGEQDTTGKARVSSLRFGFAYRF